ncbi:InlB B-repeat-containing protein [Clostridium botulinum]|uniref:Cell wall-binding protein n=1 Tax=Clostridium botulinum TaxID=1491 RepID=A0A6B4JH25_CLOBO|nr:InlB B-repeat-containing protein [Clostridium botulinum]EES48400.1 cell wall/surface repeat protein [Clostridium botulinum E1 str. 'BoNT E Beluga']MBN1043350.1 cell wall-binding protein [Clostridium botulinum]MBY6759512.1 InlB B-repeat-containing protein [Clostridium botulinum]MBY6837739.1 InlB B-repeat-containing protein [Clostridium botulinum]MBY6915017.1 InlB B-repeat-containing protein [Clostridium botulinum]
MKNVLLRKMLASVLTATTIITFIPIKASATWIKDYSGNWNWTENGHNAIGWKNINGNWYYFDYSGAMRTGWINDWGCWYYADSNGVMQTGIVEISGNIYAFDDSGIMQKGNVSINGQSYKFNDQGYAIGDKIPSPIKAFDNGNNVLPYGSKPPYSNSGDSSSDSDSEDDIFKDVETIKVRYKVTFNTDGGSSVSAITNIKSGKTIDLPKEPTKSGYKFDGWYKDDDFDKEFTEDTKIRSNMKVYAKWIKEDSSDGSDSGDSGSTSDSIIINNIQVIVGENESDIGNVKVSARASNYAGLTETTIDLIDKETNEVKKTQTLNIGGSGYIGFTFTGVEKGTYYAKITVGKVTSNSPQFIILSKDEIANSDVIKDMNELRLQDISLVTNDLRLPTKGSHGSTITWKSSDSNIIDDTGTVNRPDGIGTEVVRLTATLSKGSSTPVTKEFNAYVKKFDKNLGDAVKGINDAANNGANEEEKILAIKNKLTTSSMVAIGVSESQHNKYKELKLTSTSDENQTYQLAVAKAIYDDLKSNNYISESSNENVYKKELENEAIGIIKVFDLSVNEQYRLKKEAENQIESDNKLKEAKAQLTKVINEQYSDGALRHTLIEEQDKNTKESWTSYISALTKAIEVEFSDTTSLSSIENAINYLESSRNSLTGAYLVTINLYKNNINWSDFKGTISFQKGTSSSNIDAEVVGGSSYKATLTKGQYKILVDGKYTGETINVIDKTETKELRYYTVRFEMKKPDIIDGKIIAKYGNTIDGYSEINSSEAILDVAGNELILMADANSNYTSEFRYLWKKTDGSPLDGSHKVDENSARIAISNIKDYGKIELVCEVNPNELIITNINGVANNDNSGSAVVTAKVYEYGGQDKKVEVFKDNVLFATKTGNDVDIDANGNLKTNFTGLEKGSYKIKVTIGSLQRESSGSFYVNKIDQAVLESVNAINEAMKADATDSTYTKLRELFSPDNPNSRYLIAIGLNIDGYSKLIESTNKYTIEVAKSVYRPLEYSISDVNTISKAFNDAVTKQTNIKKTDDANSEATENLKKAKEALKNALDNAMESDRITWKKKDTDYTEESWNKYVSAVMSAIKVEQNSTATLSQITSTTNTLTNAESALKEGFEGTIKINKDGNLYDGIGTITLKKFENGSFGNIVSGDNVSLGTIKTKRIESGYYNIFVNGKDTGIKVQIGKGLSNSEVLEYYTFNFALSSTSSINASGSTVTLTEVNNRLAEKERNKVIKSGDAVLKENNVVISITPIMVSGVPKESEFVYQWTEVTSDINTATVYNVSKKSDVTCSVKPKNPVIINVLTSSDKTGKVTITGQIDCDNSKSVKVELLSNGNPLNPSVSNDKVGLGSDGKFSVDLNAPTSGKYIAKVTIDSVTKSSNTFDVNIEATP